MYDQLGDLRHCTVTQGKISHSVEALDVEIPQKIQQGLVILEHIVPLAHWNSTFAKFKQMVGMVVLPLTFPQPPLFLKEGEKKIPQKMSST